MIGIDTNVLLRAFQIDDDPQQSGRAKRVIKDNAPVFINDVVLAEFARVCKQTFKLDRSEILLRLEAILESPEFAVARPLAVSRAVDRFRSKSSDFADWLIGESNLEYGCEATLSFDKDVNKVSIFIPVP